MNRPYPRLGLQTLTDSVKKEEIDQACGYNFQMLAITYHALTEFE